MKIYRSIVAAAALPLILSFTGCVIVTDPDGDWERYSDSWEHRQQDNHAYITDLRLGTSMDVVRTDLGRPDFSEGYASEGREVIVMRYRTHHRHSDGETTFDETTPLVFVDGALAGWGENVVNDYPATRYSRAN
ncbi:MAG: DUF3192 domain-containing protein [Pseudomonadota bacterium]